MAGILAAGTLLAAPLFDAASEARAEGLDYDPTSEAWNGVSELLALARTLGVTLVVGSGTQLEELDPATDGVLVLYPTRALPAAGLLAFLRAGGRLAVADDFGEGGGFFERFEIARASASTAGVERLRGEPALLVAHPAHTHPLTDGVSALVTNRPAALTHASLAPLFVLGSGEGERALVLSGTVDAGRLVAIGDPSVFLNQMLVLDGNRRFASQLLGLLAGGENGRVFLYTGDSVPVGGHDGAGVQERLGGLLVRLTTAELPADALIGLSVVLFLLFAVGVLSAVERRDPFAAKRGPR